MATLAIKGHATRGSEVIGLLEMLGGKNQDFNGFIEEFYYCTHGESYIGFQHASELNTNVYCAFTLEQFLEKYPYKVGDKVTYSGGKIGYTISSMKWADDKVEYFLEHDVYSVLGACACDLQPYIKQKEETTEEKSNNWAKWDLPEGYEFQDGNGNVINATKIILVKKQLQLPKTYEECCDALKIPNDERYIDIDVPLSYNNLLNSFTQLLICRDAYWKIAGDWKPDWNDNKTDKYIITNFKNEIVKDLAFKAEKNSILAFPTEEMRDAFYENFDILIEQCKELL